MGTKINVVYFVPTARDTTCITLFYCSAVSALTWWRVYPWLQVLKREKRSYHSQHCTVWHVMPVRGEAGRLAAKNIKYL